MKSKVYFIRVNDGEEDALVRAKFSRLLNKEDFFGFIRKGDSVVIKTHFGEEGNTGHVKPPYIKIVAEHVLESGGSPSVVDSNVLYRGKRTITKDHIELARAHGFTKEAVSAPVVIAEGPEGKDVAEVRIDKEFVKTAKIAPMYLEAGDIIAVSHFKGHLMTGFGGAVKNIGMGCASREGKLFQHSNASPYVDPAVCTGCGSCVKVCPVGAIKLVDKKARIDPKICIGCAECIATCTFDAVSIAWDSGADDIQEKMAEYAYAVLKDKKGRLLFINFAVRISKECDCWTKDFPRISPDIGILVSTDPVAVDKASFDLVNDGCQKDVFREAHPGSDGLKQLVRAQKLGLGSMEYELIHVS